LGGFVVQSFRVVGGGSAGTNKGALGFFIGSNGGGVPYRLRIKGPSFVSLDFLPGCGDG
jgi:NADH:ubiquinone oxidoreductase subunit D